MCGNCKGKGHDTSACPSKGGGKHVPKGKGKGAGPNFFGGKGGKGGWKGKGKGKGKISEFDDSGWAHLGAAAEWNWAAGSDWAAAAPSEAQWPPAVAEAQPPWIAAAQPAWPPVSTPAWPLAAGGAPAAPPGLRSMSLGNPGFYSLSLAPVPTRNRFQALEETNIVDSNGAAIFREKIVELKLLVKPNKSKKKRRGKEAVSSSDISTSTASGDIYILETPILCRQNPLSPSVRVLRLLRVRAACKPPADLVTPVRVTNTLTTAKLSSLILAHGLVLAYVVLIVVLIIHIFLSHS